MWPDIASCTHETVSVRKVLKRVGCGFGREFAESYIWQIQTCDPVSVLTALAATGGDFPRPPSGFNRVFRPTRI